MNDPKKFRLPERNPLTHASHRREAWWQITFPLLLALVLLLAVAGSVIWVAVTPVAQDQVSRWADVSTIWLLLPVLGFSVLFLAFFAGITYGIIRLIQVVPGFMRLIHNYVLVVQSKVNQIMDLVTEPFLKTHSAAAGLKAFRRHLSK